MKNFPENPAEAVSFDTMINDVREALEQSYTLTPKLKKTNRIPYDGYDLPANATNPTVKDYCSPDFRKYNAEHNRDDATTLLIIAAWLGMEQQKRIIRKNNELYFKIIRRVLVELETYPDIKEKQDRQSRLLRELKEYLIQIETI